MFEIYDKIKDGKNKDGFVLRSSDISEISNEDSNQYEDENNITNVYMVQNNLKKRVGKIY